MFKLLKIFCALLLVSIIAIGAISCSGGAPEEDNNLINNEANPSSGLSLSPGDAEELNSRVRIIAYFVNEDLSQFEREIRHMEMEEAMKSTESIASAIVTEVLRGPTDASKGIRVIPEGTRMLAPVTITGNLAVVNLSQEFVNNNSEDKKQVEMSIYTLVNSVTEIKELDRVRILIDGREAENINGEVDMSMPFKRNHSLIPIELITTDSEAAASIDEEDDDVLLE